MIDTTKLRELANKATPGPWEQINHIVFTEAGDLEWVVADARSGNSIIDAAFIAAANPATVWQLLDEIDRLRTIESAARNLAKVKGRHHSELAMDQLLDALG